MKLTLVIAAIAAFGLTTTAHAKGKGKGAKTTSQVTTTGVATATDAKTQATTTTQDAATSVSAETESVWINNSSRMSVAQMATGLENGTLSAAGAPAIAEIISDGVVSQSELNTLENIKQNCGK